MTDITNQKLGGTGTNLSVGSNNVRTYTGVLDIKQAVADGLTAGDNIQMMSIPSGAVTLAVTAFVKEALVLGTTPIIDIGHTDGDPDEYVDAYTTTTVGAITATALAVTTTIESAERLVVCEVNGATLTSGLIAWTITVILPSVENPVLARPRVYPN